MSEFDAKARELFERSVQQMDDATVRRLRLARRSSLSAPAPAPAWRGWSAGLAAAAVLALGLTWWLPRDAVAPAPLAGVAAVPAPAGEPMLVEEDEDADLYAWLGEAPVAADDAEQRL